jgi:hypothetical protein
MVGLSISNSIDITGRSYSRFNPNFIIEVDTSIAGVSNSDQFQFTGAVGEYDVEAYQNDSLVASFSDLVNEQTITLPSSGVYELRVIPKAAGFDKLTFNNSGDKDKLLKILQWGLYGVNEPDQTIAFWGCNLTQIPDGGVWFDVVTTAGSMFRDNSLTSLPTGMKLPNLSVGFRMFFGNDLTLLPTGMELTNLINGFGMFRDNSLSSLSSGMELPNLSIGGNMFISNNLTSLPSGMELPLLSNGNNMFLGSTINTERYSQLLIDLEANNNNNNVPFDGGNSQYNAAGQTARNALIARGWTITDGGLSEEFYFNIEVDTAQNGASNSDQFQFTGAVGEYDVEAYQNDSLVASFSDLVNEQTITLPSSGVYELRVIPKAAGFDKLRFDNGGDKDKLLKILQWGLYGVNQPNQERAFLGCLNLSELADGGAWFDVVTDGGLMFLNASLTALPSDMNLSVLDTASRMFENNSLTSLPTGMQLDNLTIGINMFEDNSLTALPENMNLSSLINGSRMFLSNSITSLPNDIELPLLTNGFNMFRGNSITSLPNGMELPLLNDGNSMFRDNNLTTLPTGMELPNLNNGGSMFLGNTINTTRYSQLLIDLEANNPNNNVAFDGGNSQYNAAGQTARNALIARGWTITDGGLEI